MLITLIAWVYITFLCFTWGSIFINFINKIYRDNNLTIYGFVVTCFIGLAFIGTLTQIISLFTGLGSISVQVVFFLPAIFYFLFFCQPLTFLQNQKIDIQLLSPVIILLIVSCLLMTLTMSAYYVTHPDTLAYHEQIIKWADHYKVIPGLANINYLYGLQNSWFLLCSFFRFSFAGLHALTFVNTTVLAWVFIFICQKINAALKEKKSYYAFLWFILLAINLWMYTAIRLTATSASADFIAAIYVLLTAYVCIEGGVLSKTNTLIVIFLCLFSITLKLSVIPLALLCLYLLYPINLTKTCTFLLFFFITIVPFCIRNAISSGHLFYPSPVADIISADWKFSSEKLQHINQYVLYFARTHRDSSTMLKTYSDSWPQRWLSYLSLPDKLLIAVQFFLLIFFGLNYKKILQYSVLKKIWISLCLTGLIFWFIKAPDPRFGLGFLLLLPALILSDHNFAVRAAGILSPRNIVGCLWLLSFSIITYSGYRFANYFESKELIMPEGIAIPMTVVYYKEVNITIPLIDKGSRNFTIVPETVSERAFNFRGIKVEQGFTNKKK